MSAKTAWESFRVEGRQLLEKVEELIKQGNVRRIVILQGGRRIAEFPLMIGVAAALIAPVLAAVAALATALTDGTIEVERTVPEPKNGTASPAKKAKKAKAKRRA